VALMNDQKFNGGIAAPLFGVMAHTAPGPSTFALRFGTRSAADERAAQGQGPLPRRRARSDRPAQDRRPHGRHRDRRRMRINAFMEERIRERPAEWFWVHKRWPNELYAELAERERAAQG
jgi:KDO2-lipid IV(A) lauroyltransferase